MFTPSRRKLLFLLRRDRLDDDLRQEMDFHMDLRARQLRERGISEADARQKARREFGNVTLLREEGRDAWTWAWLESVWQDVRFGARQLRQKPGFAAAAILTLALGIGANTAIFTLLNAVLLRQVPVLHPEDLVFFGKARQDGSTVDLPDGPTQLFSYPFFREFRQSNHSYSDVVAVGSILNQPYARMNRGAMEGVRVELVSGGYFDMLGVKAIRGHMLKAENDWPPGGHPYAVASYSWWQRRFALSPSAVGSTVTIGSTVYTIVGIAPSGFFGMTVGQSPDLWIPLTMQKEISPGWNGIENKVWRSFYLIGRLKPGVRKEQAEAETNALFRQIVRSYLGSQPSPKDIESLRRARVELTPAAAGRSPLRNRFALALRVLLGVVGLVLLIACANVANLLLARGTVRRREIAVRMSMGAGRGRVVRQLVIESGLLGLAGALLGTALAWSGTRLLVAMVSVGASAGADDLPFSIGADGAVLAFTFGIAILTVLLCGAAPAFFATDFALAPSLKEARGGGSTGARGLLPRSLVVIQVAMSLVLLAGAGLFLRSLTKLTDVAVGFDKRNVLLFGIEPGSAGYKTDGRLQSTMRQIEERVELLHGVQKASFVLSVFDGGGWTDRVITSGHPLSEQRPEIVHDIVGADYLDVLRIPIVLGRGLRSGDTAASRRVAVINETMAREYFAGVTPLGQTFTVNNGIGNSAEWRDIEVVGVMKDAKYFALDDRQDSAAFYPHAQHLPMFLHNFVVRYTGEPAQIIPAVRKAISEIDTDLPLSGPQTLVDHIDRGVVNRRVVAQLSTFFGLLAAFLACIGIYGVLSYGVATRTNEFGIRMALGAKRENVLWIVERESVRLGAVGVVAGLLLALGAGRLVASLLYGTAPQDPASIGAATLAMLAVALLAGLLPARRATRIDPMVALRHE